MEYVVKVQANATKHELRWAWRFTVLSRADGRCQWCGKECYLDACHVESRAARPDLEFDPSNGIALCRSCHMKHDHKFRHRPSGRPVGHQLSAETKQKIGNANRLANGTPEKREMFKRSAEAQWSERGRKHPLRDCDQCGSALTSAQCSRESRFCSAACHYLFRTGKPRSGY